MGKLHKRCTVCVTVFFYESGNPDRCPRCEANDHVIPFPPSPAVSHRISEIGQVRGSDFGTVTGYRRRKR